MKIKNYIESVGECPDYGVYLASLSDYNNGRLVGKWYDFEKYDSFDEILKKFYQYMNKLNKIDGENREEWDIHDVCGFSSGVTIEEMNFLMECLRLHLDGEAAKTYLEWSGGKLTVDEFQVRYAGCWDSLEDYAMEYMDSTGQLESLPESLRHYFNYSSFARDMELNGDVYFENGHLFYCY